MKLFTAFIIASAMIFCFYASAQAAGGVSIGSSREDVIAVYGKPSGVMVSGDEEILSYPGGMIVIRDGVVSQMDDNFSQRLEQRREEEVFKAKQKAKGLIQFRGKWITPAQKKEIEKKQALQKTVAIYSNGGQPVDLSAIVVPGKVTIIDFYADWCRPCVAMAPYLERLAQSDRDVFLRKIDIVRWGTPVTQQFNIRSIPDIRVFDRSGRMVGPPTYDFRQVQAYVQQAK